MLANFLYCASLGGSLRRIFQILAGQHFGFGNDCVQKTISELPSAVVTCNIAALGSSQLRGHLFGHALVFRLLLDCRTSPPRFVASLYTRVAFKLRPWGSIASA
jgi:hypothetical protein